MSRPIRYHKSEDELLTTARRSVARKWKVKADSLHAVDATQSYDRKNVMHVNVHGGNWNYRVSLTRNGRVTFNERQGI